MSIRLNFPDGLLVFGALLGATPLGWWFGGLYGTLMAAHVAISLGFLIEPTRRRLWLAALLVVVVWWPVWLGQWLRD